MKRKIEKFIFGSISVNFPLLLTQKNMFFRPQDGSSRPFGYFIHLTEACTNKCSGYVLLSLSHVTGIKTK